MEKNTTEPSPGPEVVFVDRARTIVADPKIHSVGYTKWGGTPATVVYSKEIGNWIPVSIYMNVDLYAKVVAKALSAAKEKLLPGQALAIAA